MDLPQLVILNAGWMFMAAWGMVLAVASVLTFKRDIGLFAKSTKRKLPEAKIPEDF